MAIIYGQMLTKSVGFNVSRALAMSGSRAYSQKFSEPAKISRDQDRHIVEFAKSNLSSSYANLYSRLESLSFDIKVTAAISSLSSLGWVALTSSSILASPVAMSILVVGGGVITNRMMQIYRLKSYAELSALTHPSGLSNDKVVDKELSLIVSGGEPKVKLSLNGMEISGPIIKETQLSPAAQKTLERIRSMERVVIPTCMVRSSADSLINATHDRWLSRLSFPISILNLVALAGKEKWRADDYVAAGAATHNIYDYMSGSSVEKVRGDLSRYLGEAKTPKEVLEKIVSSEDLKGSLSFLNEWSKDASSIAVRVGRTGELIFYKNEKLSFGGPFPAESFPSRVKPFKELDTK